MRSSAMTTWALAGLFLLSYQATRADTPADKAVNPPFKPAVLLRLKGMEELIAQVHFLVKEAGQEEEAKQIEALLKARTGPQGLEGIDVKKPIGLYGTIKPSLDQSEVILLLPIADEKTFLDFLDTLNLKLEKSKDSVYTLQVENFRVPILFRFANNYLYATLKLNPKMTLPGKDRLPSPEKVLAGGSGLLSLTANIDQIPAQVRKLAISSTALILAEQKEQELPSGTEKQKAVRNALLDEASRKVKALIEDATTAELKIDLDQKTKDVSLVFRLEGKPDSTLVKDLGSLAPASSVSAGVVGKDSIMSGRLHLGLPASVKKAAVPAIEEAITRSMDSLEKDVKELLKPIVDALKPTATAGVLDIGADLRGPGKMGKHTLVAAVRIENGEDFEKAIKDLLAKLPAEARDPITTDVARTDGVNIHQVKQKNIDEKAKQLFGTGPAYFAVRKDALMLTVGEDALEAIKEVVAVKPKAGQPLHLELSVARLAPLMDQKAAPEAAKKAFREKGSDKVNLTLEAGKHLELKLNVQTAVLAFGVLLDRATKEK